MRLTESEYEDFLKRRTDNMKDLAHQLNIPVPRNVKELAASTISPAAFPIKAVKPNKFRAQKITIDEITFDSKREYNRWCQLKMLESKGTIQELKRQVRYELAPAVKIKGKTKPALRYFADFVYQENGQEIVEDAKGHLTDVFKIKRHLMMTVHNIEIKET